MQKNIIIQLDQLTKTYHLKTGEHIHAVNNLNLTIPQGEFCTIIGASGSGKTTLLNLIGGLDKPTSGSVIVDGEDISKLNERDTVKFRREKVGFVFQSFNLIQTLTATENIEAALAPSEMADSERINHALTLLESVGLKSRINHLPNELSAGEQQRVAIARALANKPKILLLDEPTGNLDTATGKEIMKICHCASKQNGQTVLAVTHASYVKEFTDRLLYMQDGKIQTNPVDPIN